MKNFKYLFVLLCSFIFIQNINAASQYKYATAYKDGNTWYSIYHTEEITFGENENLNY